MKRLLWYSGFLLLCVGALWLPFTRGSKDIDLRTLDQVLKMDIKGLKKQDASWIRRQYHLNEDVYQQAFVVSAYSAMEADEIAVFKQEQRELRAQILAQASKRLTQQEKLFQGYAPKQSALLKKAEVYEDGRYVVVIVSKKAEDIRSHLQNVW